MQIKISAVAIILSSIVLTQPFALHAKNNSVNSTRNYTDRIIVKFKPEKSSVTTTSKPSIRTLHTSRNISLQYRHDMIDNSQVYSLGQPLKLDEVRQIASELMQRDDVEYAEPDARRFPAFTPIDASYGNQWYLFESAGGIRADQAWDITRGSINTVTAVIDTGITEHSELSRLLPGYDFISEDSPGVFGTANDGDGRDNDPSDPGDFITSGESTTPGGLFENCPVSDSSWHGTLVAGIIIAETDNSSGIAGIDHNGFVLPIRALGKCGGYISDIADAIRWASGATVAGVPANTNPADVINLSLGGEGPCSISEQSAIDAAIANNAIMVVAAGNEGGPAGDSAPGNCDNVINVAATSRQGAETLYTNIGSEIDLSAPGGSDSSGANGILSTSNSGTTTPSTEAFASAIGTSFAAPMVAGAAALIKGLSPAATPIQIEAILKNTARPFPTDTSDGFGDCNTNRCGAGILELHSAVAEVSINPPPTSPTTRTFTSTGSGAMVWLLPLLITMSLLQRRNKKTSYR